MDGWILCERIGRTEVDEEEKMRWGDKLKRPGEGGRRGGMGRVRSIVSSVCANKRKPSPLSSCVLACVLVVLACIAIVNSMRHVAIQMACCV